MFFNVSKVNLRNILEGNGKLYFRDHMDGYNMSWLSWLKRSLARSLYVNYRYLVCFVEQRYLTHFQQKCHFCQRQKLTPDLQICNKFWQPVWTLHMCNVHTRVHICICTCTYMYIYTILLKIPMHYLSCCSRRHSDEGMGNLSGCHCLRSKQFGSLDHQV